MLYGYLLKDSCWELTFEINSNSKKFIFNASIIKFLNMGFSFFCIKTKRRMKTSSIISLPTKISFKFIQSYVPLAAATPSPQYENILLAGWILFDRIVRLVVQLLNDIIAISLLFYWRPPLKAFFNVASMKSSSRVGH